MTKKTVRVEWDGQVFTKESTKNITHVIMIKTTNHIGIYSSHGSLELAQKRYEFSFVRLPWNNLLRAEIVPVQIIS
jgi:hypothetical protein